ncbi:MAG TPA: hypothetical protein DDY37_02500 [Legionella sp.]|nr:hypothetical protein [Legionella sp.]
MSLPLARNGSNAGKIRPNADSWKKLVEIAGKQLESLEYLEKSAHSFLKKEGLLKEYDGLMNELSQIVKNAQFQENTKVSPWLGDTQRLALNETDFSLFHKFLASENAKAVVALFANQTPGTENVMNYAVSVAGEYIRNFTFEGEALEGESLAEMDGLFNAWLVENNMINSEGVLYERTASGEIKQDKKGKPAIMDSEKFKDVLHDKKKGFEHYVQGELSKIMPEKKNIHFAIKGHDYVQPAVTPRHDEPDTRQEVSSH